MEDDACNLNGSTLDFGVGESNDSRTVLIIIVPSSAYSAIRECVIA